MSETSKPINVVSLTLGIIGVVIGVMGLLLAWVPFLGLPAIPVGIIGFVLSLSGFLWGFLRKEGGFELPVLGGILCILAISLSLVSTHIAEMKIKRAAEIVAQKLQEKIDEKRRAFQAALEKQKQQEAENRQAMIHRLTNEIVTLTERLPILYGKVQSAQFAYDKVQGDFENFQQDKPYTTNAVYKKFLFQLQQNQGYAYANASSVSQIGAYSTQPYNYNRNVGIGGGVASSQAANQNMQNAQYNSSVYQQNADYCQQQLNEIIETATQFHLDKINKAERALNEAKYEYSGVDTKINRDQNQLLGLQKNSGM